MFHRKIKKDDVVTVIKNGQIIIDYPDDNPYPSCLILGFINDVPLHIVFAMDNEQNNGIYSGPRTMV